MIYRFTIISDEVDDFVREIQIDPEATFYDFHEAILKSAGYTNDQMTSFFICDDDWEKEKEITLEEMDDNPEMDSWVMKETQLSELVEDEKQKLLYVFDYMTERCFFIELSEIITGKEMKGAKCTKKAGEAPKQTIDFEEMAAAGGSLDLDENFYGDQVSCFCSTKRRMVPPMDITSSSGCGENTMMRLGYGFARSGR